MEIKSSLKNIRFGMVKNGCVHAVCSQFSKIGCIARWNQWNKLIYGVLYKFRKAKSYVDNFSVLVVKNCYAF